MNTRTLGDGVLGMSGEKVVEGLRIVWGGTACRTQGTHCSGISTFSGLSQGPLGITKGDVLRASVGVGCPVTCSGFLPQGNEVTLLPSAEASQNEGRHHVAFSLFPPWGVRRMALASREKRTKPHLPFRRAWRSSAESTWARRGRAFWGTWTTVGIGSVSISSIIEENA